MSLLRLLKNPDTAFPRTQGLHFRTNTFPITGFLVVQSTDVMEAKNKKSQQIPESKEPEFQRGRQTHGAMVSPRSYVTLLFPLRLKL